MHKKYSVMTRSPVEEFVAKRIGKMNTKYMWAEAHPADHKYANSLGTSLLIHSAPALVCGSYDWTIFTNTLSPRDSSRSRSDHQNPCPLPK